tara:strand:- start:340113 stop:342026 length:1914 start_codon:yes stop_codon:yes gene_type:complete
MKNSLILAGTSVFALAMVAACTPASDAPEPAPSEDAAGPTIEDARAFIENAEETLANLNKETAPIYWEQATNITPETNAAAAAAGARTTTARVEFANATREFVDLDLPIDLQRKLQMIQSGMTLPAPSTEGAAEELNTITAELDATYSTGTYAFQNNTDEVASILDEAYEGTDYTYDMSALTLDELSTVIETSRNPDVLQEAWEGWRTISPVMAPEYARMVEIATAGANELGYDNVADMWLSQYDMPPEEMEAEVERLWEQVSPLYDELHCYVRGELNDYYGDEVQPASGPIRADLLGNMWAQSWQNIYGIVAPEDLAGPSYDLTTQLRVNEYTPIQMVETGEAFFSSLGFEPLPETFWERSMIVRPPDRDVVCHASAWDLDDEEDIRIKMCTEVNAEDFQTVHHELGHNYYQRAYRGQDHLFKEGAHDGFHEAIGDFVALSITPYYLQQIGLISEEQVPGADADLSLLLDTALDKIAFLPFAITVDQWRWGVLDGSTPEADYNTAWWELREANQGIVPPGPRPDDAFDPGAKYHIPGNTPYLRYFLSYILQFQFHQAACEMAGWEGPLHRCSIYGNEEVGERLNAMLEMGASEPWRDALEAFTGTREMDGSAITAYFDPLIQWMREENEGRQCGWQ